MSAAITARPGSGVPLAAKISVAEYHRMIAAGVFHEGDPFELLDGVLVRKMTRLPPHDVSVTLFNKILIRTLPSGWTCRSQCAVTLSTSEPEPDGVVARGDDRDYATRHPGPQDIGMLAEVADSSLAQDRDVKGPIYARESIPVYWIINLVDELVEVYTNPTGPDPAPRYRDRQDYRRTEAVPLVIGGQVVGTIPVADLLA